MTVFVNSVPWLNREVHQLLGETVACATVSPLLYILSIHTSAVLPATPVAALLPEISVMVS